MKAHKIQKQLSKVFYRAVVTKRNGTGIKIDTVGQGNR